MLRLGPTRTPAGCRKPHPGATSMFRSMNPAYEAKWAADGPKRGCVVNKVKAFRAAIEDTTKTADEKRFALRFLVHLVGDMHMPLHVGENARSQQTHHPA
jgi:nuclease S1